MGRIVARLVRGLSDRIAPSRAPADFDADFYRGRHPDLAGLTAEAAARHYARTGAAEGRSRNLAAMIAARGLRLPPGYDLHVYREANRDLGELPDWELVEHLERHGVREGRRHREFNADLYRELNPHALDLSDTDAWLDFRDEGAAAGRIGSGRELARARGWPGGAWIEAIRPSEFRWLNWRWADDVDGVVAAAVRLVEAGSAHLASPSFAQRFDAAHVRETHPQMEGDDAALHRAWLFTDARRLTPGNAGEHLRRLGLRSHAYPQAFAWRSYAAAHPEAGATRWSALEHLLSPAADGSAPPPCDGPEGAAFFLAAAEALAGARPGRAMAFVAAAKASDAWSGDTLRLAAAVSGRCGRWEEALELSRAASGRPDADLAVFLGGARAAVALDRPGDALALLAVGKTRHGGSPRWPQAAGEAIAAQFDAKLKAPGADVRDVVADCRRLWAEFERPSPPTPTADDGRVTLLVGAGAGPTRRLRLWLRLLDAVGRPCTTHGAGGTAAFVSDLPGCAAAVFVGVPADPWTVHAVYTARRLGVRTIHDAAAVCGEGDARLCDALAGVCDVGVAATPGAADRLREAGRMDRVHLLPDGVEALDADAPPPRLRRDDAVVILHDAGDDADGFSTSTASPLVEALEISAEVRLLLAGDAPLEGGFERLRARTSRISRVDPLADPEGYAALMAETDLVLERASAPPSADDEAARLLAATAGVPTVGGGPPDARAGTLGALVADADRRRSLGRELREAARREHSTAALTARLDALLPRPAAAGDRPPRVLLVNVFFAPQTFGGATRVVEENLRAFLHDPAGAGFDFAVATTDFDAPEPYRLRVDDHLGTPVFRFGAPGGDGADRRAFDSECGRIFGRILDAWKPDLVHFHCIQRITASAVAACADRGTPYLVTLHDGWWVSDHQFLLDAAGELEDASLGLPRRPTPGVPTAASLRRRRDLGERLRGARRVLAVSESFAALHRRLGFDQVKALPNGSSPLPRLPRTPSASGRIRLCHVGGAAVHKGLPLLQACLLQSNLPGLELTVLEPERAGGAEVHEVWGATPVRRVGRVAQAGMAGFYAEQDVLVAPSLWPESFGLVTREAIGAGLWAVAGDRGAIGDAVTPGVNGWVVDVSTPAALATTLAEIAADPDRYRASPPEVATSQRTGADQVRELLAVYQEVLAEAAG